MKNCEAADNIDREREGNPTRTHIRTSLSFCRRNQLQREQYLRVKLCRLRVGCALLERLSINRRMFCARTVQTPQSMKSAFRSLHQMIEAKGWNGPNYGEASAAAAPDGFVAVTGNCDPIGMAGLTLDGGHGERNRAPFHNLSLGELAFADGPGKMLRREASFNRIESPSLWRAPHASTHRSVQCLLAAAWRRRASTRLISSQDFGTQPDYSWQRLSQVRNDDIR